MPRQLLSTAALIVFAVQLGACGSPRFEGPRGRPQAAFEPISPAPAGRVTSEPLAPPPGAQAAVEPSVIEPEPPPPVIAEAAPPPVTPSMPPVVATGRSSVIGGWTATDATGSCRVALSSSPALDLYKASTTGCANKDLAKISAWDYRDGEVFLYQPGGTVTARLRQAGASLDGAMAKSGSSLSMVR